MVLAEVWEQDCLDRTPRHREPEGPCLVRELEEAFSVGGRLVEDCSRPHNKVSLIEKTEYGIKLSRIA